MDISQARGRWADGDVPLAAGGQGDRRRHPALYQEVEKRRCSPPRGGSHGVAATIAGFHGVTHRSPFLRRQAAEGLEMVSPGHVRLRIGGRAIGHRAALAQTTCARTNTHQSSQTVPSRVSVSSLASGCAVPKTPTPPGSAPGCTAADQTLGSTAELPPALPLLG